jgi:hypothetical protein
MIRYTSSTTITLFVNLWLGLMLIPNQLLSQPTKQVSGSDSLTYINLAEQLVKQAKQDSIPHELIKKLATVSKDRLDSQLSNDRRKLAFWINIYNAFIQFILQENPTLFEDRGDFFSQPRIIVAGQELSFDDVEHGIIRRSKNKYSGGYLNSWFVGDFEKRFRVDSLEPRIHFALNCGARSCPEVAIYEYEQLYQQLDQATREYLQKVCRFAPQANTAYVTSLFSWFRGDFGGKDGIREMLRDYDIIPSDADPYLEFTTYDWTLDLDNYKSM